MMVLVNEAQGYRVCLECGEQCRSSDKAAWLAFHLGPHVGPDGQDAILPPPR
jgi:hypothetical protein